jgi:hypothetical protein
MSSIKERLEKIKGWLESWFGLIAFVLVAILAFLLGRLSKVEEARVPIRINFPTSTAPAESATARSLPARPTSGGAYVASKNGTKYYLLSCSGANRIKAENKVYFATKAEAEKSGLTPATNCPGI